MNDSDKARATMAAILNGLRLRCNHSTSLFDVDSYSEVPALVAALREAVAPGLSKAQERHWSDAVNVERRHREAAERERDALREAVARARREGIEQALDYLNAYPFEPDGLVGLDRESILVAMRMWRRGIVASLSEMALRALAARPDEKEQRQRTEAGGQRPQAGEERRVIPASSPTGSGTAAIDQPPSASPAPAAPSDISGWREWWQHEAEHPSALSFVQWKERGSCPTCGWTLPAQAAPSDADVLERADSLLARAQRELDEYGDAEAWECEDPEWHRSEAHRGHFEGDRFVMPDLGRCASCGSSHWDLEEGCGLITQGSASKADALIHRAREALRARGAS